MLSLLFFLYQCRYGMTERKRWPRDGVYLPLTRVLQEASDDSVTRLNFSLVLLYDCHCNFLYERFHLSERLCAWRKQPDRLLASTGKRRSETSCLVVKTILGCVPGQSTLVSHLMPPKSRAHVFFDIGNSSHFRDVHLIGGSTLYRACVNLCLIKHVIQLSHERVEVPDIIGKRSRPLQLITSRFTTERRYIDIRVSFWEISTSFQIEYRNTDKF